MEWNREDAQFSDEELDRTEDVAEIVKVGRSLRSPDGTFQPGNLIALSGIADEIVRLVEFISKGSPGPEDDAQIGHRLIALGTAYARGSGATKLLGSDGS